MKTIKSLLGKKGSITTENVKQFLVLQTIKMVDIGILTAIYFILGYTLSWIINKIYYNFDKNTEHNKVLLFFEIFAQVFVLGILFHLIRNFINIIPFPLEGIMGYEHKRVRELKSGGIAVGFGIFYAQDNIKDKLNYLFNN